MKIRQASKVYGRAFFCSPRHDFDFAYKESTIEKAKRRLGIPPLDRKQLEYLNETYGHLINPPTTNH